MLNELNLTFPDAHHVVVSLNRRTPSRALPFSAPFTTTDHEELSWYLEVYGARSVGDPDDAEARRIAARLPELGRSLFTAVFHAHEVLERFSTFRRREEGTRLLTISAEHPSVLTLPWELLHNPSEHGVPLFLERPQISVRRRVLGADDGREPFDPAAKDVLRLLFVVSRPTDAGFIDPRADTSAVLDAIDAYAPGRVVCEFLRAATFEALLERLDDPSRPAIDILHFDGHGLFDPDGGLPRRLAESRARRAAALDEILRDVTSRGGGEVVDPDSPPNTGYLLFEGPSGAAELVSAMRLGAQLHRRRIALVILSACQSAAIGGESTGTDAATRRCPIGSVAVRLTATGIPSVLAMTHSVLAPTTRTLFATFYRQLAREQSVGAALDEARG